MAIEYVLKNWKKNLLKIKNYDWDFFDCKNTTDNMYLAKKYIVKEGHCSQIEIKKKVFSDDYM